MLRGDGGNFRRDAPAPVDDCPEDVEGEDLDIETNVARHAPVQPCASCRSERSIASSGCRKMSSSLGSSGTTTPPKSGCDCSNVRAHASRSARDPAPPPFLLPMSSFP